MGKKMCRICRIVRSDVNGGRPRVWSEARDSFDNLQWFFFLAATLSRADRLRDFINALLLKAGCIVRLFQRRRVCFSFFLTF